MIKPDFDILKRYITEGLETEAAETRNWSIIAYAGKYNYPYIIQRLAYERSEQYPNTEWDNNQRLTSDYRIALEFGLNQEEIDWLDSSLVAADPDTILRVFAELYVE